MTVNTNSNGEFTSLNPTCPIISYSVLNDGNGYYNIVDLSPGYQFELVEQYLSVIDTYPEFEIQATAEGGAQGSGVIRMRVGPPEYDCEPASLTQLDGFSLFIPLTSDDDAWVTLINSGRQYVSEPSFGCIQHFRLLVSESDNLVDAPDYYDMNEATGELRFHNQANNLAHDNVVIAITQDNGIDNPIRTFNTLQPPLESAPFTVIA